MLWRPLFSMMVVVLVGLVADEGRAVDPARPYRSYLVSTARDGQQVLATPGPEAPLPPLPPLHRGWPTSLKLGEADAPGGAPRAAERGLGLRYQYLAGGANTGTGWVTWSPGGTFAADYARESQAAGVIPVFSYYMVRQSLPGANMPEAPGVAENLTDPGAMRAIFDDLEQFFRSVGGSGAPVVVLHFEPDLWGYLQQRSKGDDAATVGVSVASSGHPALTQLPNTAAGLAQAVLHLRDLYGPNVLVAYHLSTWGTGTDPLYADPSPADIQRLAERSAAFYRSLGAAFDLTFAEMSDRDAAFKQFNYGDGGASWWDEGDFSRFAAYLGAFSAASNTRIVLWQLPQGNTVMRAMNNTWNHYQDNKVEWFLGDGDYARLKPYVEAGVIALLFGRGADGATCACDANGDGITNPAPINGNGRFSVTADDDGGYFEERRAAFVAADPIRLQ